MHMNMYNFCEFDIMWTSVMYGEWSRAPMAGIKHSNFNWFEWVTELLFYYILVDIKELLIS